MKNMRNKDEWDINNIAVESVGKTLFKCMEKWQNNIGQIDQVTGEEDTFGNMRRRAIRTALKLQSMGLGKGDMISTCSHNHLNSRIPELASFFMGAIPSNFDPILPELDTIVLLKLIEPKIIFTSLESLNFMEKCLSKAEVSTKIVVFGKHDNYISFDEFLKPSLEESSFKPIEVEDVRETAAILFSSGTTGNPKGICLSHITLLNEDQYEGFDDFLSPQSVYLVFTTLYWMTALMFLIRSILTGGKNILSTTNFDPSTFWSIVDKYKVEFPFITPYQGIDLMKSKRPNVDTSSVKIVGTGSCLVTQKVMNGFRELFPSAKIINLYGMTETGGMVARFDLTKPADVQMQRSKIQSLGRVLSYIKWKVVDPDTGKVLGPNQKGELLIKTVVLMNGYYKQDNSHVFDHEGYMRTGDIVYYDKDNCLFYEERIKEMFKYRGWHIMPSIVEEVVLRHQAVKEAVVVGIPHEEDGHHPMALVVLDDNYPQDISKQIMDFVNNQVSDAQKLRGGLKIVKGGLPKTASGKLKRTLVRKMVLNGSI